MPGVIEIDTRQKEGLHTLKHTYFAAHGYQLVRTKLYVGDYRFVGGTYCVDTKQSISEIASNIDTQHERFRNELIKARDAGYYLTILVENDQGIDSLSALATWTEPQDMFRLRKHAVRRLSGARLAKAMQTMAKKYDCAFEFCSPKNAGEYVIRILESENEQ